MTLASGRRTYCTWRRACSTTTRRRTGPDWPRRGSTVATPREAGAPRWPRPVRRDTTFASRAWRRSRPRTQRRSGAARRAARPRLLSGQKRSARPSLPIVDQGRRGLFALGICQLAREGQRLSVLRDGPLAGSDNLAHSLLGPVGGVSVRVPHAQRIEIGRPGDRVVLAVILERRF